MSGVLRGKYSPCPHTPHHPGELQGIVARVQYSDSASPHLQTVDQLRVKLRIEWQRVEYNMADTPEMEPGGREEWSVTEEMVPVNIIMQQSAHLL